MTCKLKVFCKQGETCVAHEGYDIWRCTGFKDKGVPMTNEEYIKSLETERLAEHLWRSKKSYWSPHLEDTDKMEIEDVLWWLKQPHNEVGK